FADKIEKVPLEQIAQSTAEVLDGVKKIVESKETRDLLPSANAAIGDVRTLVRSLDTQIGPLLAKIEGTVTRLDAGVDAARKLAPDVDSRLDPLATRAEATLEAAAVAIGDTRPLIADMRRLAATLDAQVDPLLTSIRSTSDTARTTLERAQLTLGGVE